MMLIFSRISNLEDERAFLQEKNETLIQNEKNLQDSVKECQTKSVRLSFFNIKNKSKFFYSSKIPKSSSDRLLI